MQIFLTNHSVDCQQVMSGQKVQHSANGETVIFVKSTPEKGVNTKVVHFMAIPNVIILAYYF